MPTPDYLFNVADPIVKLYDELNNFAISDICRRLVTTDFRLSGSISWQYYVLQQSGMSREEIAKKIAEITKKSEREIKEIFEEAGYHSYDADMSVYQNAGLKALPFAQSPQMLQILQSVYEQTNGELRNITRTTADASQKLLIDTMSEVQFRIMSGQQSYNQAIRQAVNQIANEGVKITYPSGRQYNLESVVRTAVMTGINQATSKVTIANAERMGSDLVLTTAHLGARTGEGYKGHINWQGKVFSISGKAHPEEEKRIGYQIEKLSDATGYGKVDGLCGANCRHSILVWIEGHSENNFKEYGKEENQKRYEAQQEQRKKERKIRDTKRKLLTLRDAIEACTDEKIKADLQEDYNKQALKLRQQQKEYKQFCKENGLQTENERMQIAKYSRKDAAEAYRAAKREEKNIADSVNNDTMKETKDEKVIDVHTVGKIDRDIYKCITEDIVTDEVIITDNQIQHIMERHPNDYERFSEYFGEIVSMPDYIIETSKPNTALVLKEIRKADEVFKTVIRLVTSSDNPNYKNSIITFMKIDDKEWKRLLRNKKILYKRE